MNALELTTAVNSIAAAIAAGLSDDELELVTAVLSQIASVLSTILVQRAISDKANAVSPVFVTPAAQGQTVSALLASYQS